jgi:hypothetical protein
VGACPRLPGWACRLVGPFQPMAWALRLLGPSPPVRAPPEPLACPGGLPKKEGVLSASTRISPALEGTNETLNGRTEAHWKADLLKHNCRPHVCHDVHIFDRQCSVTVLHAVSQRHNRALTQW